MVFPRRWRHLFSRLCRATFPLPFPSAWFICARASLFCCPRCPNTFIIAPLPSGRRVKIQIHKSCRAWVELSGVRATLGWCLCGVGWGMIGGILVSYTAGCRFLLFLSPAIYATDLRSRSAICSSAFALLDSYSIRFERSIELSIELSIERQGVALWSSLRCVSWRCLSMLDLPLKSLSWHSLFFRNRYPFPYDVASIWDDTNTEGHL